MQEEYLLYDPSRRNCKAIPGSVARATRFANANLGMLYFLSKHLISKSWKMFRKKIFTATSCSKETAPRFMFFAST